jgi:hypothetical protein
MVIIMGIEYDMHEPGLKSVAMATGTPASIPVVQKERYPWKETRNNTTRFQCLNALRRDLFQMIGRDGTQPSGEFRPSQRGQLFGMDLRKHPVRLSGKQDLLGLTEVEIPVFAKDVAE